VPPRRLAESLSPRLLLAQSDSELQDTRPFLGCWTGSPQGHIEAWTGQARLDHCGALAVPLLLSQGQAS
jgi:hypothetical protein